MDIISFAIRDLGNEVTRVEGAKVLAAMPDVSGWVPVIQDHPCWIDSLQVALGQLGCHSLAVAGWQGAMKADLHRIVHVIGWLAT